MHGPHQPIGTDTFAAQAIALRVAERVDALILPDLSYTWAGSTDGFAGTISVEPEASVAIAATVIKKAHRMGFRRIVIISIHAPNQMAFRLLARRIFETDGIPALFVDVYTPLTAEAAALFAGDAESGKEASIVLAALEILGRPSLYNEEAMRMADKAPPRTDTLNAISGGQVGYFMQDPRHHACPSPSVSIERGRKFITEQVRGLVPMLENHARYCDTTTSQPNQGWWR